MQGTVLGARACQGKRRKLNLSGESTMSKCNTESNIWRNNVVKCALGYANHLWKPSSINSYHGYDEDGILVNTPDSGYKSSKYNCGWWLMDQFNKGIPYNWGGCSTIVDFSEGIMAGKYAGNVPDSRENGICKNCVGVDCSGLVTICWELKNRLYTKTIPAIASPLKSMDLLLPGDVILLPGSHVMIFIDFINDRKTSVQIVDASRSTGRVMLRTVLLSYLSGNGYIGYRKNDL